MSKGLNIGFIGVGQCGGNIVNEFAKLGYTTIAINTAQSDLDKLSNIHIENRLLINFGIQGAGKNPEIGENAFIQHNEEILKLVEQAFSDMDIIYVCAGLGGGTGSGIAPIFTQVLLELEIIAEKIEEVEKDIEKLADNKPKTPLQITKLDYITYKE